MFGDDNPGGMKKKVDGTSDTASSDESKPSPEKIPEGGRTTKSRGVINPGKKSL